MNNDTKLLFFDDWNGGPGIGDAFDNLTPDSRVRLEWFGDDSSEDIHTAEFYIRDGRLHKQLWHPLTLVIRIKFKNGDDKCKADFGFYEEAPWFDFFLKRFEYETKDMLTKRELIELIRRAIDYYQEAIVSGLLRLYKRPILKDYSQFPDDYKKFKRFLNKVNPNYAKKTPTVITTPTVTTIPISHKLFLIFSLIGSAFIFIKTFE